MIRKVIIVDKAHPALSEKLESAGFVCTTDLNLSKDQYQLLEDHYVGLVIRSKFQLDREAIDSKKNLKFIVRLGAGMENIDVSYAESKGIKCISTPEGNAPAVAQMCLGLLLDSLRSITTSDREVRNGEWLREKNKGCEIGSLTIGIIGFGNTGKAFANILKSFNPKILVYDRFKSGFDEDFIEEVPLNYLLENSDVVSVHINYIPDNLYFMSLQSFQKMKQSPIFLNSSRGLVVNTEDLLIAIDQNLIQKACLDVLEFENVNLKIPPKEKWSNTMNQLAQNEKVILTPHIAGQTVESELRHAEMAFKKIDLLNLLD